jgi:protein TonB
MEVSKRQRRIRIGFFGAVALSLLLHLFIVAGTFLFTPPKHTSDRIEVQLVETPPQDQLKSKKDEAKQVVDQDEKAVNDEIDEKAKFLSAHNQKVTKQTVATNHGDFQNKSSKSNIAGNGGKPNKIDIKDLTPKFDISKSIRDREQRERDFENDPDAVKIEAKNQQPKPTPQSEETGEGGEKVSQTVDYIKALDPGLETLLSTREFVYYTYYARIRRQLNQYWGPKVKEKLVAMYKQGRQIASSEDKITRCLVTLDNQGKLVRVQIIGISGVHELDEAAVDAFKAAAPFPNPPAGIVDEDKTIKIRWDFILEV